MNIGSYKTLTAIALTSALLTSPAFAEAAQQPEMLAHNEQSMPMDQGMGMGQGMGMMGGMDFSNMEEMMEQMHAAKTPQERQKIRGTHREAMQSQMGMMQNRMQQSRCPAAKDETTQQQCMKDMHENMQNMLQIMDQMLKSQSVPDGQ